MLGWDGDADPLLGMCQAMQGRGSSMRARGTLSRGLRSCCRKQGQGQVDDTIDAVASALTCGDARGKAQNIKACCLSYD